MIESQMTCPTHTQWERFLTGDGIDADSHSFEQHLDHCPTCAAYLQAQHAPDADSLDLALSTAIHSEPTPGLTTHERLGDDTDLTTEAIHVQGLIERIRGLTHRQEPIDLQLTQERAAEVLWLLEPGKLPNSLGCLAHYDLLEFLGAGSSGVVFAARDQLLHRDVAIKILRPSLGALAQDRFLTEARAIASLAHENIVTIYEVGQDHGLAYFTMPWLPGESLEKRLQDVTFLPEQETRELAKQVSAALDAANQRQLVHRDVKPANIWVDTRSQQCKLLDFGLARAAEVDATATATGMLAGTPSYMSPEQTRGEELDHRSDLFSLGCLLYRCMTGRLPFVGTGVLAILQAIQHHDPIAPDKLNSACSQDLSRLIMALLEKDPAHRPRSATEVRQALDLPVEAWPWLTQDELTKDELTKPLMNEISRLPGSSTTPTPPQVALERKSKLGPPIRGVVLALTLGLFSYGLWLMVSDVIRIQTADGEIVIETDDPSVQIEVLQDGQLIHILDAQSQRSLKIAAGTYSIQPSRSATDDATFQISPGIVELTRGEKRIVKVSKMPAVADHLDHKVATGSPTSGSSHPTYQGRTIEQWVQILAVEHDTRTLADGIKAMSQLMGDDPQQQDIGINLVREVLRKYGLNQQGDGLLIGQSLESAINAFFSSLSPEQCIAFLQREMLHGNLNSLLCMSTLNYDISMNTRSRPALRDSRNDLQKTYIRAITERCNRGEIEEASLLASLAQNVHYWQFEIEERLKSHSSSGGWGGMPGEPTMIFPVQDEIIAELKPTFTDLHQLFHDAYQHANHPLVEILLARFFNHFRYSYPEMITDMLVHVNNAQMETDTRMRALGVVLNCVDHDLEVAIPALLDFAGSMQTLSDLPAFYSMSTDYHGVPRRDIVRIQVKGTTKSVDFHFHGISEVPPENQQYTSTLDTWNRSLAIPPASKLRLNILQFLHRIESPSAGIQAMAVEYLRKQIRNFTEEEGELAREGIKPNMSTQQRECLSDIYVQAIINHLANATLQNWNIEMDE